MSRTYYIAAVYPRSGRRGRPPLTFVALDEDGLPCLRDRQADAERFDTRQAAEAFALAHFGYLGNIEPWKVQTSELVTVTRL